MPPMPGQSRSLLQFNAIGNANDIADMADFQVRIIKKRVSYCCSLSVQLFVKYNTCDAIGPAAILEKILILFTTVANDGRAGDFNNSWHCQSR
jgi:hypothetical protein